MPTSKATSIHTSEATQEILQSILRRRNAHLWLVIRVKIIMQALAGYANTKISQELGVDRGSVRLWRERWHAVTEKREVLEADAAHRIRFIYVPKHSSCLNQIEIWFSILVRRLLKRASFTSLTNLKHRILDFIDYFNNHSSEPTPGVYSSLD